MPYAEIPHFLWLVHTARDWERDMERETIGFCVTLCAVIKVPSPKREGGPVLLLQNYPHP